MVFWCETYRILVPQPAVEPTPPAQEGDVLATGQPGKSQDILTEEALFSVRSEFDSVASHWDQERFFFLWTQCHNGSCGG